jgi:hypothetical protein
LLGGIDKLLSSLETLQEFSTPKEVIEFVQNRIKPAKEFAAYYDKQFVTDVCSKELYAAFDKKEKMSESGKSTASSQRMSLMLIHSLKGDLLLIIC